MSDAATDQVLGRIDALAATLGVTAQHLWAALVRQGLVEGYYGLLSFVICAAVGTWIVRRSLRHDCGQSGDCIYCGGGNIAVWIGMALLFFISMICLDQSKYLFNPEGYAAEKIVAGFTPKASK